MNTRPIITVSESEVPHFHPVAAPIARRSDQDLAPPPSPFDENISADNTTNNITGH